MRISDWSSDVCSSDLGDKLTALAKPKLKTLKLSEEFTGYTLRIHPGLDSSTDIVLGEAKLSNFEFKAIAGGSVEISFSLAAKPDEAQAGRLYGLVQTPIDLSLDTPKAGEQQQDLAARKNRTGDSRATRQAATAPPGK